MRSRCRQQPSSTSSASDPPWTRRCTTALAIWCPRDDAGSKHDARPPSRRSSTTTQPRGAPFRSNRPHATAHACDMPTLPAPVSVVRAQMCGESAPRVECQVAEGRDLHLLLTREHFDLRHAPEVPRTPCSRGLFLDGTATMGRLRLKTV